MTEKINLPEYWLRGPVYPIPALLQPVAHALLQAQEEINNLMLSFQDHLLFKRPAGVASPAFHILHICGVLDRLFTYAKAETLSNIQLAYLKAEPAEQENISVAYLLQQLNAQISKALQQLTETNEDTLTDKRTVGRKQLPSTVGGLLFHAAEHTMRHAGQLMVTVKMIKPT